MKKYVTPMQDRDDDDELVSPNEFFADVPPGCELHVYMAVTCKGVLAIHQIQSEGGLINFEIGEGRRAKPIRHVVPISPVSRRTVLKFKPDEDYLREQPCVAHLDLRYTRL